jgi:hypothetical protein
MDLSAKFLNLFADFIPEIFLRIELRRIGRKVHPCPAPSPGRAQASAEPLAGDALPRWKLFRWVKSTRANEPALLVPGLAWFYQSVSDL